MAPAGPARLARRSDAGGLLDSKELDVEQERRARRNDPARAALPVAESRGNHEPPLPAHRHAGDTLIPALDNFPAADAEAKGFVAIARAVEFLALVVLGIFGIEPAGVMHHGGLPRLDGVAAARLDVGHDVLACAS